MDSRPYEDSDLELAQRLLSRIYLDAPGRFFDALKSGKVFSAEIFESGESHGIQPIFALDDFKVCYVSFDADPDGQTIERLWKALEPHIAEAGPESLFLNMNAENPSVVAHFLARGFRKDRESLEYCFTGADWPRTDLPQGMECRGFNEMDFEDYIWLLDNAFRPQLIRNGQRLDPYWRNMKRTFSILSAAGRNGEFASYWKGDSIVALYLLRGHIILDLAVTPVYQGTGIGSAVLSEILDRLVNEEGHDTVVLYVSEGNGVARHLYEKFGFRQTASHVDTTYVGPDNLLNQE